MPEYIKHAEGQAAIASMIVEIMEMCGAAYFTQCHAGSRAIDTLILAAVFVGQAERRLMTAAKLAEYAKIPRPTVIRRLEVLQQYGIVTPRGKKFAMAADVMNRPATLREFMKARRLIIHTAAKLSKMDINQLARPGPGA